MAASATRRPCWRSGTKGLELALAKPQTYMNDSGRAVRRLLASYHVPLVDLLVVADDFALPFGKLRFREAGSHGGHNGLRSIIDELGTEKFSRLRVGHRRARARRAIDHVLSPVQRRRARPAADPPRRRPPRRSRRGPATGPRRPPTGSTAWELQAPAAADAEDDADRPKPGEVGGPADDNGRPPHEDRLAADPARRRRSEERDEGQGRSGERPLPRPDDPPAERRREGRPRVGRAAGGRRGRARRSVDLDAGVGRGRGRAARSGGPAAARRRGRRGRSAPGAPGHGAARRRPRRGRVPRRRPSRPGPRGAAAAPPRDRLVRLAARAARRRRRGARDARPARRPDVGPARGEVVPRRGPRPRAGRRADLLGRARRGDRRPGRGGARARGSATRRWSPSWSRGPRSPTSAASSSRTRPPPGSRPSPRGERARRRSSSPASRRCSRRRSRPTTCPAELADAQGRDADRHGRAARRAARARLRAGPRGRRPGRVRAPRRHRRRVPAVARRCRSGSSSSATRSTRLRAFDPTDQRSPSSAVARARPPARDGVPAAARRRGRDPGAARPAGVAPARAARAGPRAVRRRRDDPERPDAPSTAGRALAAGDAAEVWARLVAPSTGLDHLDPSTLLVLDEPGDLADAADFLWRQAEERHARAGRGGRPAEGLADRLPPAARLEGAPPRRADAGAHLAVRGRRGRRAWRSPRRA